MGNNGVKYHEPSEESIKRSNDISNQINDFKDAIMAQNRVNEELRLELVNKDIEWKRNSAEQETRIKLAMSNVSMSATLLRRFEQQLRDTESKIDSIGRDQETKIDTVANAIKEQLQGAMAKLNTDIGNQMTAIKENVDFQVGSISDAIMAQNRVHEELKAELANKDIEWKRSLADQETGINQTMSIVSRTLAKRQQDIESKIDSIAADRSGDKNETMALAFAIQDKLQGQMAELNRDIGWQMAAIKEHVNVQVKGIKESLERLAMVVPTTRPPEDSDEGYVPTLPPSMADENTITGAELYRMVEGQKKEKDQKYYPIKWMATLPAGIATQALLFNPVLGIN